MATKLPDPQKLPKDVAPPQPKPAAVMGVSAGSLRSAKGSDFAGSTGKAGTAGGTPNRDSQTEVQKSESVKPGGWPGKTV